MAEFEAVFHATQLELLLPDHSAISLSGQNTPKRNATWWTELLRQRSRDVAFFDERLTYFLALHVPYRVFSHGGHHAKGGVEELKLFLSYLQVRLGLDISLLR